MYFITCMTEPEESPFGPNMKSRCFGYFEVFLEADDHIRRNAMDMHEFLYTVAVIEKIGQGIHAHPEEKQWYRYKGESRTWEPAERPEVLGTTIGFASVG